MLPGAPAAITRRVPTPWRRNRQLLKDRLGELNSLRLAERHCGDQWRGTAVTGGRLGKSIAVINGGERG